MGVGDCFSEITFSIQVGLAVNARPDFRLLNAFNDNPFVSLLIDVFLMLSSICCDSIQSLLVAIIFCVLGNMYVDLPSKRHHMQQSLKAKRSIRRCVQMNGLQLFQTCHLNALEIYMLLKRKMC